MTVLERGPERWVMRQRTLFAALFSFVAMVQFISLGLGLLGGDAPQQQAYLMLAVAALLGYLFFNAARQVTVTVDIAQRELRWQQVSLLGVREERFDLADIAEVRLDVRASASSRSRATRQRAELLFDERLARKPFPLTPHHLPGPGAQSAAAELNALLKGEARA